METLKIVMQMQALSIIFKQNNTCSCALLKINYCDTGSIYLCLETVKMHLLPMQLSLNLVNQHTLHFKVKTENKFCTLLKFMLTYHFDKTEQKR